MTDFDALLKRSFAEAHEPEDNGFSVHVTHAVARREAALQIRNAAYSVGMAAAGAAVLYGVYGFVSVFGQEFLASAGLEIARAHSALTSAPAAAGAANPALMQSIGVGLSQILLIAGVLAGGAVAYRASQQD
jgi:hypothetical protein